MLNFSKSNHLVGFILFIVIIFNAVLHLPSRQPVERDYSTYYYLGQEIGKGKILYGEVWDHKTPLTPYVTSLVYLLHQRFPGLDYILAVRWLFIFFLYATSLMIFFLVVEWTDNPWPALVASLIFALFNFQIWCAARGPLPKILMNLAGVISWWALQKNRITLAGFFGGLAFLDWQPGAVYIIPFGVWLIIQRKSDGQIKRAAKYFGGFLVPVCAFGLYFWLNGYGGDFYKFIYFFNLQRVGSQFNLWKTPGDIMGKLAWIGNSWLFYLGIACFLGYPWLRSNRHRLKLSLSGTPVEKTDMLFALSSGITVYSLINFNSADDTLPFTVPVAIWLGIMAGLPIRRFSRNGRIRKGYQAIVIAALLAYTLPPAWNHDLTRYVTVGNMNESTRNTGEKVVFDRAYQERYIRSLVKKDSPKIVSLGVGEFLLLWELSNPAPFITVYPDLSSFISENHPGGWQAIYKKIKDYSPDLIVISPWEKDEKSMKDLPRFLETNNYKLKGWQFNKWQMLSDRKFIYSRQ